MVMFGGAEIDLSRSTPAPECEIRIVTIFGGTEIRVPSDWQIVVTGTPILGALEDRTKPDASGPTVRIHASVIFGGVEIRN